MPLRQRLAAEALGTFGLVFAGTGAIVANDLSGGAVTHVGVALTFGLIVFVMIQAVGDVSGAHLNPAVTLGFLAAGRCGKEIVLPYIVAQTAGALAASFLLRLLFPVHPTLGATLPAGNAAVPSFVLELLLTAFLLFVILSLTHGAKERGFAVALTVGAVIALEALFAGPISGASMNPARSLAPALVSGRTDFLWIYLAAPAAGALAGTGACRLLRGPGCCGPSSACPS
jgi:aquaporin Z